MRGGGRGLWLVNHLCDLVQVRSSQAGNVIRLHMSLDAAFVVPASAPVVGWPGRAYADVKAPVMDPMDAGRSDARFEDDEAMAPVLAIVHGLPDATVGSREDGRIVFANALAGELFGYAPEDMVGRHVQTLWPERVRERYLRNMRLYFATEHPLRFTTEAWGLRADGSEFVGEMSWGIVDTQAGPLLLAIGRDVSARRAAERRLRAVSALGERALAGAPLEELAADAVEQLRLTLPLERAELRAGRRRGARLRRSRRAAPRSGSSSVPRTSSSPGSRARSTTTGGPSCARWPASSAPRWCGCAARSGCATRRCTTR